MMELKDSYLLINETRVPLSALIDTQAMQQQMTDDVISARIRLFEMVVTCTEAIAEEPDPSIIFYGLTSYKIPTPSIWDIESYIVGKTVYQKEIIIKHLPINDPRTSL